MKQITALLVLTITFMSFGQKASVDSLLTAYGIKASFLETNVKDADADYAFDMTETTVSQGSDTKIQKGHFDPTLPIGERWTLTSVDGKSPSKKELRSFSKEHNSTEKLNGEIDQNSWSVVSDDAQSLVLSFKYKKETLPKKQKFLGDCEGKVFFDKNSKQPVKATFGSDKTLHIKIFRVVAMNMEVTYDTSFHIPLVQKEVLDMTVELLGTRVPITVTTEYSNYKKMK